MMSHELTNEDRIKKTGKPNRGTAIVNSIKNRVNCNEKCRIFWECPMMPLSISRANPDTACLLNKGGNALIKEFIDIFVRGEEGLVSQINKIIYSYGMDIEVAPPGIKKDYALLLMQWHKQRYSDPTKQFEQKPNLTVVINEMTREGKMIEVPIVPVLEAGAIRNVKNDVEMDMRLRKELGEDPESLFSSPMIDALSSGVKSNATHHLSPEARGTTRGKGGRFMRKEGYVPKSLREVEEVSSVSEPDNRAKDDEPARTEGESQELAETSERTGSGS